MALYLDTMAQKYTIYLSLYAALLTPTPSPQLAQTSHLYQFILC